ncbi:EVE domain-containing protein [Maridesulfovibrio frigidus]|uniref:EVE domain-containing protein n=1 Tax=Maridesulfovibrio frigidus TaxID=340956 RepID=UPI000AF9BA69|nr:EVE domain-containing protein [Maridesulfovibrio frigidus]
MTKYWLMKSEPGCFSIDDLAESENQTTPWDGVRNYQARNFMRDQMEIGDRVLFYHSIKNPSVVGTAEVVKESYPDFTAWDPDDPHFDPKSSEENPRWFMVDIKLVEKFSNPVPLKFLRTVSGLEGMELLRKGSRLSVMPVAEDEFNIICRIGRE